MPIFRFLPDGEIREEPLAGKTRLIQKAVILTSEQRVSFGYNALHPQGLLEIILISDSLSAAFAMAVLPDDAAIHELVFRGLVFVPSVSDLALRLENVTTFLFGVDDLVAFDIAQCRCETLLIACTRMQVGLIDPMPLFSRPRNIDIDITNVELHVYELLAAGIAANERLEDFRFTGTAIRFHGPLFDALRTRPLLKRLMIDGYDFEHAVVQLKPSVSDLFIYGSGDGMHKICMYATWGTAVFKVNPQRQVGRFYSQVLLEHIIVPNLPSRFLIIKGASLDGTALGKLALPPNLLFSKVFDVDSTSDLLRKGETVFDMTFSENVEIDATLVPTRTLFGTNTSYNDSMRQLVDTSSVLKSLILVGINDFIDKGNGELLAQAMIKSPSLEEFTLRIYSEEHVEFLQRVFMHAVLSNPRLDPARCSLVVPDGQQVFLSRTYSPDLFRSVVLAPVRARTRTLHISLLPSARPSWVAGLLRRSGDNALMTRVLLFLLDEEERGAHLQLLD